MLSSASSPSITRRGTRRANHNLHRFLAQPPRRHAVALRTLRNQRAAAMKESNVWRTLASELMKCRSRFEVTLHDDQVIEHHGRGGVVRRGEALTAVEVT